MGAPRDIVRRLRALDLAPGRLAFVHLGQLGFLVRMGRTVFGCDLFLSPMRGRLVPPQLAPEDVADVDFLVGSHDHADHIDRPLWRALARLGGRARFVVPASVRDDVLDDTGLEPGRVTGIDAGETRNVCDVRVTAFAAAHERLERDSAGRFLALGFVMSAGGARICHSGDCCPYEGLGTVLSANGPFDAMFLPVNGRDAWRLSHGFIGCMDAHEAVELAGELGAKALVPGHHDMFARNPGDVRECVRFAKVKYPRLKVVPPRTGRMQKLP